MTNPADDPEVVVPGVGERDRSVAWWTVLVVSALVGIAATSQQILEKLAILKSPDTVLFCDVNSVLSCTNVLNAWQSSVLGPPNALVGGVLFAVFLGAGGTALLGTVHSPTALLSLLGLIVFFALFATWFMATTAFVIGALCLWCIFITTATFAIGASITRVLASRVESPPSARWQSFTKSITGGHRDLIVWGGWWVIIAVMLIVGLAF